MSKRLDPELRAAITDAWRERQRWCDWSLDAFLNLLANELERRKTKEPADETR